ncbi:MAG: hypothetical protein H6659_18110 [Ardenticatenaceae bacterium]|nr:hypothetical protein [Ardenticatenaceae bacterium]
MTTIPTSPQEREAYTDSLQQKIETWENDFLSLEERAHAAEKTLPRSFWDQIEALRARLRAYQSRTQALGSAGEADWDSLSEGMEETWAGMEQALQQAQEDFEQEYGDKTGVGTGKTAE